MALISRAPARLYFDANIFIYAYESRSLHGCALDAVRREVDEIGQRIVTSELSLAECLMGGKRSLAVEAEAAYVDMITQDPLMDSRPIARDLIIEAARYGNRTRSRWADAMHVVTALTAGCSHFLTNDQKLKLATRIEKLLLSHLADRLC